MGPRIATASIALMLGAVLLAASAPATVARGQSDRFDVVLGLDRPKGALERFALEVSTPASPRYGRYVSPRQVGLRFGAGNATVRAVLRFLRRNGIRGRVDITRSFVEALVPARRTRRLFGTPGRTRVPRGLRGRVREVLVGQADPGDFLPRDAGPAASPAPAAFPPPHVRTGTPSGCSEGRNARFNYAPQGPVAGPAFTPNQIQDAYGAAPLHAAGITGRGVRVAIYGAGGLGLRELRAYARCFGLRAPPARLVMIGRRSAGPTSGEAALDLQMVALMAPGITSFTSYSIASTFWPVGFSAIIDPRNGPGGRAPHVVSVSLGECETGIERAEVGLAEHVLAAAAAAGITVAAGAGDNGSFCPDGPNRGWYPAASRWMTAVGGTAFTLDAANRIVDEIPWNDRPIAPRLPLGGGGGLSRFLPRPAYQAGLGGWGNRRGYPDVALIADSYPGITTYCNANRQGNCVASRPGNAFRAGFGTSAASPLFAGIVALANQRLLAARRPPIGFANPLLYLLGGGGGGGALHDIVAGSNAATWPGCCSADPGYDRASGWGSVNAQGLADVILQRGPR
jgi:subtilase family serine protease